MRFATSPRLLQVGREEREAKLRDFVEADINARHAAGAGHHVYTLLARAPDSPVARAIATLAAEFERANVTIRAVLLDLETFTDEPGRPSLLDHSSIDIRLLSDPRFTSAHEQLVLGAQRVWIGDCMRRDPAKRDAFEIYHDFNETAAKHAETSFSRLWASAKDVSRLRPVGAELLIAGTMADEAAATLPATRR